MRASGLIGAVLAAGLAGPAVGDVCVEGGRMEPPLFLSAMPIGAALAEQIEAHPLYLAESLTTVGQQEDAMRAVFDNLFEGESDEIRAFHVLALLSHSAEQEPMFGLGSHLLSMPGLLNIYMETLYKANQIELAEALLNHRGLYLMWRTTPIEDGIIAPYAWQHIAARQDFFQITADWRELRVSTEVAFSDLASRDAAVQELLVSGGGEMQDFDRVSFLVEVLWKCRFGDSELESLRDVSDLAPEQQRNVVFLEKFASVVVRGDIEDFVRFFGPELSDMASVFEATELPHHAAAMRDIESTLEDAGIMSVREFQGVVRNEALVARLRAIYRRHVYAPFEHDAGDTSYLDVTLGPVADALVTQANLLYSR